MKQDLLQSLLVRKHALGHTPTLLDVDHDVFAVGVEVDEVEQLFKEGVDIEWLLLEDEFVGLDTEVILCTSQTVYQHVAHEVVEDAGTSQGRLQVVLVLFVGQSFL